MGACSILRKPVFVLKVPPWHSPHLVSWDLDPQTPQLPEDAEGIPQNLKPAPYHLLIASSWPLSVILKSSELLHTWATHLSREELEAKEGRCLESKLGGCLRQLFRRGFESQLLHFYILGGREAQVPLSQFTHLYNGSQEYSQLLGILEGFGKAAVESSV